MVDWGLYGSLGQTLLKLCSPGVPDIYQGQELWEFWLVDPDNRRPVDFALRRELLAGLQAETFGRRGVPAVLARRLAAHPRDGRLKLLVTWQALHFRRRYAELFQRGQYEVLTAEGAAAEHVCAFAWRRTPSAGQPEQVALVVVPRLVARLAMRSAGAAAEPSRAPLGEAVWTDTRLNLAPLAPQPMKNLFTGQVCPPEGDGMRLAALLADFPVALLSNLDM